VRHEFLDGAGGCIDRHDLVVVAVDHQRRLVEAREVAREIGGRERRDAVVSILSQAIPISRWRRSPTLEREGGWIALLLPLLSISVFDIEFRV
jgi:hypothetical protein